MNPLIWHKVAAISGVAALGLGTYGAHAFKPQNPSYKDVCSLTFYPNSYSLLFHHKASIFIHLIGNFKCYL